MHVIETQARLEVRLNEEAATTSHDIIDEV